MPLANSLHLHPTLQVRRGDGRPHPTKQMVVTSEALPGGSSIGWLFKRVG